MTSLTNDLTGLFSIVPDFLKFLPIFVGWIGHMIIGVIKPHVLSMT